MDKEGDINIKSIILISLIISIFFIFLVGTGFVFADHIINVSGGGVIFYINEDISTGLNVSVANTDPGGSANITQVNISLPTGLVFRTGTNLTGANVSSSTFVNTSSVLSWTNTTTLINGSSKGYLSFNVTAINPGTYTFEVITLNQTGNSSKTLSVVVNDTTPPSSIQFVAPTLNNNSILVQNSLPVNVTATDNGVISSITARLYNSTRDLINSSNSSSSPLYVNFTGLQSGTYYINATINDTYNNLNSTETRIIILANQSFPFNGTARDENGNALNNTNINITIRNINGWSVLGQVSTTTNASGWFNMNVALNGDSQQTWMQWMYEPSLTHFNATSSFADFKSKTIPAFPYMVVQMIAGTTFYLTPAGTINITVMNSSGDTIPFRYQVKDTKFGYPVAMNFDAAVNNAVVYVPRNRNYSLMVFPNENMPVSFSWNNFSSTSSYSFNYSSSYNATSYTLHKRFNVTTSLPRVWGYINFTGISGWNEFTVVPYLLEPSNMAHAEYGDLPYNLSSAMQSSDFYNLTTGYYNISVPATAESSSMTLFATTRNGTNFYGGIKNISLNYGSGSVHTNFTQMTRLVGVSSNITMERIDGGANINISIAKKTFTLVNASNGIIGNTSAHVEITVDYSNYGAIEFTWMTDIDQSSAVSSFSVPLLNVTGIKEMNIYANGGGGANDNNQYAPKRISYTAAQISGNASVNITITNFNPQDIEGAVSAGSISMELYVSNSTCDVPNPANACSIGGSKTMNISNPQSGFNPMQAVMGGGKLSFRMGTGNILVHYVNVDLLASGPPDALFDRSTTNATTASSFEAAARFGSGGPTIYEYVLVSIPYVEGNSSVTGLNENSEVNLSIPNFYDDSWNIIWNTTANGTSASALAGNYSHYSTYQAAWGNLTMSKACTNVTITSSSQINETNPCYIDTTNNKIWIRVPHFSGTGPKATGNVITATSSTSSSSSSGSGGSSTGETTFSVTPNQLENGYTKSLSVNSKLKMNISGEWHYAKLTEVTANSATIEVSSTPQLKTLLVGDLRKFDVNEDDYYDLSIKLNSVGSKKASVTVKSIYEKVTVASEEEEQEKETRAEEKKTEDIEEKSEEKRNLTWLWVLIGVVIVVVIVLVILWIVDIRTIKKKSKVFIR